MSLDRPGFDCGSAAVEITCVVPRQGSTGFHDLLKPFGVGEFTLQSARRTLLREARRRRGLTPLAEELVDIVRFHVPPGGEEAVVPALVNAFGFGEPGRGSLTLRTIFLAGIAPGAAAGVTAPGSAAPGGGRPSGETRMIHDLACLCSIVPRGVGTAIARVALEAGLGVPVVTYGRGVGSRGRLGLIRVTIPVEKEIVTFLPSLHDIDEAFRLVNEVMRLSRPGAGFCYWYPLAGGILDTRIWAGRQPFVASMEQVIATLDVMTGGTAWRRKAERIENEGRPLPMASYTIQGNEGETEPILRAALDAGAGGATQSWLRRERLDEAENGSSAREMSDLIVEESTLQRIHQSVCQAGLLGQDGFVEISDAGAACGYHTS